MQSDSTTNIGGLDSHTKILGLWCDKGKGGNSEIKIETTCT